jgi:translation initiation factor 5
MANDRYIVNGAHQADRLRELLDAFIDKFVLCASCKNPETELVITGRGNNEDIHRDCKACGAHTGIDMRHKLTTFILKNPPKKDKKKGKKGMTAEANVGGPLVFDEKEGSNEDDSPSATPAVPTEGTEIDAMLGRGGDPILDNPDALANKVKNLDVDDDDEDEDSPFYQLRVWLSENQGPSDAEVVAKLKELDIVTKHKALVEIGHKLFTTENAAKEIEARSSLLNAVSTACDLPRAPH